MTNCAEAREMEWATWSKLAKLWRHSMRIYISLTSRGDLGVFPNDFSTVMLYVAYGIFADGQEDSARTGAM